MNKTIYIGLQGQNKTKHAYVKDYNHIFKPFEIHLLQEVLTNALIICPLRDWKARLTTGNIQSETHI